MIHFKCNGFWYVQKDGLAIATSLALILAYLWLKEYEPGLMKVVPKLTVLNEVNKEVRPGCQKKVTPRTKGVEGESCLNWYHLGVATYWNPNTPTMLKQYGIAGLAKATRSRSY